MGVSSRTVWRVISENAAVMRSTPIPEAGEIWAYDNVNIMVIVQQLRQGHRSEMKNWTSRLTVPIRHVPDEALSTEPKGRRKDLSDYDFLPSKEDMTNLKKRFGAHIKAVLSSEFLSFANHKKPPPKRKSTTSSTYRPLQLMGANEATTSDNIQILRQFATEAGMTAENCWDQEVIGDQATCKNIRGARRYRQDDVDDLEKLTWAKECPGDFHFLWETGRCLFLAYWSSPKNIGSLAHLKDAVDRRTVDSLGKKFNQMDEFLHHACEGHLVAALLQHLEMDSPSEVIEERTEEELEDLVHSFMDQYIFKRSSGNSVDDSVFQFATSLLQHLMLYTDLRQCIRDEDGPAVVAHWRFWLPTFLGTGRSQYSTEAANHLANLMADWSQPRSEHTFHRRPRKTSGYAGGALQQEVSLAVPLIDEARRLCDKVFGTRQTVGHTSPSATKDICSMYCKISEGLVYQPTPGRRLFYGKEFTDVVAKGMKRITVDNWLTNFLSKDETEDEEDIYDRDPDLEVDLQTLMDE
ncbi:hypothetical protein Bbelb_141280 [Branchiostoma belcheri]|nr:hypothetical protein Bbelb_141280 [Branchiostoma belcheri]